MWQTLTLVLGLVSSATFQCYQLSRIIRETPDFGRYLPVNRLESDISRIMAKVALSCKLDFPTTKIQIFAVFDLYTVNMERFLINSGMPP